MCVLNFSRVLRDNFNMALGIFFYFWTSLDKGDAMVRYLLTLVLLKNIGLQDTGINFQKKSQSYGLIRK